MLPDKYSCLLVGSKYSLKVGLINYFYALYRPQSTIIDPIITETVIQKHCDSDLICRTHDARSRSAAARAVQRELQARRFS